MAWAQTVAEDAGAPKRIQITRIDVQPTIDGVMNEDAWTRATLVDDLHQINPVEYAAPSERTEIRLY